MGIRIAIDGPASSGKGTVARLVARTLGYSYIDTGAMYRSVALFARRSSVDWGDAGALASLTDGLQFGFSWVDGRLRVTVNGEDVTAQIRTPEISRGASEVSVHPGVRAALVRRQRALAARGGLVMEGRDIGTVVLPDAELKVYLDADVRVRAARRAAEQQQKGLSVSVADVVAELRERDARDKGRAVSPLRQADDAVYLDTTPMSAEAAAARIIEMAAERT